ncbi:MAG: hypothetical protein Q8N53_15950, partial [Longimicrobiales bacterium]|nr:hypothetical protein [Longimicrobiales bacterium]
MRRQPIMGMRPLLTAASMVGILAVAACEGGNLFTGPGQSGSTGADTRAPTVDISVPRGDSVSGTAIGDSVFVSVHLTDKVGVRSVTFSGFALRGDANLGTLQELERFVEKTVELQAGVKDTTLNRYLLAAADSTRERAYVVVEAKDSAGNATADTASLSVGGPSVELQGLKAGQVLSSGTRVGARITASDPKGVSQLRLEVRGAVQSDISRAVAGDPTVVALDTSFVVADTASGFVTLTPLAKNRLGVIERGRPITVLVEDRIAPLTSILQPRKDSLSAKSLGDSLLVTLRVTDSFGVRSVRLYGIARRGNAAVGTDVAVVRFSERTVTFTRNVRDTTFSRYLTATADSTREAVFVVAESRDSVGNVSADTARIVVGGPRVALTTRDAGQRVSAGGWVRYELSALDSAGLAEVRLEVTGAVVRSVAFPVAAGARSLSVSDSLAIPDTAAGLAVLRATARNALGARESSSSRSLTVLDGKPPVTSILLPRGDSLSAKPLGDSVLVIARVSDNFGVRTVRMRGIAQRGDKSLGTDTVVDRFVEKTITLPAGVRDTTLSRYLRATKDSLKETAQIVVIAADSAGNQSSDTVNLVLGGPDVEILDIVNGQTIQAGLGLTARVRAQDPLGITQVRIQITGAFDTVIVKAIVPPTDSVSVDTVVAVPVNVVGPIQITAIARNALDVAGQDGPLTMIVVPAGAGDTIRPVLKHASTAPARMEMQDSVTVQVTGSDQGGGVAKVGYTVLAISPTRADTLIRTDSAAFDPPRTGTVTRFFKFGTFNVDSLSLPDTLVYEISSWMRDAQGNCASSVGLDSLVALPCDTLPGGQTIAKNRTGQRVTRSVVAGKTVLLPRGGRIMDAAVDTVRRRMFLSNITNNRLDVFDLSADLFLSSIGVGSEPWGLSLNRAGDSLWVANSGGTNLSVVGLSALAEKDSARLLTPDVGIFEITIKTGDSGAQWTVEECPQISGCSFSDRPQFVAVDSLRNLIYSTKTTEAGLRGTARKGYYLDGMERPEVKMFVDSARTLDAEDVW